MNKRTQLAATPISIEIETPEGSLYRLDSDTMAADLRPTAITFRTQRGDGFADGSFRLRRSVLRDYPDLTIGDSVRYIGGEGQVLYEGCIAGLPRELAEDGPSVTVPVAGWMSHAKDRRFREIFIDRDPSHWLTSPSLARQKALISGAVKFKLSASSVSQTPDPDGDPAIGIQFARIAKSGANLPYGETWYAADIALGEIGCDYQDADGTGAVLAAGDWTTGMALSDDDVQTHADTSADLGGTSGAVALTASGERKYASLYAVYVGADKAADGEWSTWFANLYAKGTHGLTATGGGLTVSDMIANIAVRFCPLLDTSGIQATTYPVRHAEFIEATYPYDAFQKLNLLHLWELSVFEDRKLIFEEPAPLDDYDWQVRTDDPGVRLNFSGDTLTEMGNGVEVRFTDLLTGVNRTITPDDYPDELLDTDPDNPMNRAGRKKWLPYDLSFPVHEEDAVQYGRAFYYEATRAKSPVSITVGYHIRDRAGNRRPAAEVRCGQRIAIVDHPNDAPRRIIDTTYNHDGRGLTISADRASQHLPAIVDRINLGRQVAGL